MSWELILWLFAFVFVISLIGLSLFQLITLSDLEFDYINPFDSSSRINALVLPEFLIQGLLCAAFLLTGHWFSFLLALPVTCFHLHLYMKRRHLLDVTEIFRLLSWEKKYRIIKLALYVTLFVIVIYRYLFAIFPVIYRFTLAIACYQSSPVQSKFQIEPVLANNPLSCLRS